MRGLEDAGFSLDGSAKWEMVEGMQVKVDGVGQ